MESEIYEILPNYTPRERIPIPDNLPEEYIDVALNSGECAKRAFMDQLIQIHRSEMEEREQILNITDEDLCEFEQYLNSTKQTN